MAKENRAEKNSRIELLQGTLDMLILKTLLFGPLHRRNIAHHIKHTSEDAIQSALDSPVTVDSRLSE
jgi:hypothetical protein